MSDRRLPDSERPVPNAPRANDAAPPTTWKRHLWRIVQVVGCAAVAWFIVRYVLRHWETLSSARPSGDWAMLGIGMGVVLVANGLTVILFRFFMAHNGLALTLAESWELYSLPQLGKYLPGKFASVAASSYLLKKKGLSLPHGLATATVFTAAAMLGMSLMAVLCLPAWAGQTGLGWAIAFAAAALLAVPAACSSLWWRLLNNLLRRCGRPELAAYPRPSAMGILILGLTLRWGIAAIGFFLAARFLEQVPWGLAPRIVAALSVSYVAGLAAAFAPAGLGVREALLILMIQGALGPGFSTLFAALTRLMTVAVDLTLFGVALVIGRHWKRK